MRELAKKTRGDILEEGKVFQERVEAAAMYFQTMRMPNSLELINALEVLPVVNFYMGLMEQMKEAE